MNQPNNTGKTFLSGALMLTLSTVLVKLIGLLYKIPMLSYLGSEGMGYFHSAYEIYAMFCVISTAGLPMALSVLISSAIAKGKQEEVPKIYQTGLWIFLFIGTVGSFGMAIFAPLLCKFLKSEQTYAAILSVSPSVLWICLLSAIRGYFQGKQNMLPTAISQVIEALGKLVFGIWFAKLATESGWSTPNVAAAAGCGLTLSTFLSFCYLFGKKRLEKKKTEQTKTSISWKPLAKRLLSLGIPITVGAGAVSFTKLADMALILRRLQSIGYDSAGANSAYGSYTALALSVFAAIPTLLGTLSLPMLPLLSGASAVGEKEKENELIKNYIQMTVFFAIPFSIFLTLFSEPILRLLFPKNPQSVAIAAPLLSVLGGSVFLSCMISTTNSILHAKGIVKLPMIGLFAGGVIKIFLAYFLIGNANVGLMGAPISTFACNALILSWNLFLLRKDVKAGWCGEWAQTLLFSVISVGGAFWIYRKRMENASESIIETLLIFVFAGGFYLLLNAIPAKNREKCKVFLNSKGNLNEKKRKIKRYL